MISSAPALSLIKIKLKTSGRNPFGIACVSSCILHFTLVRLRNLGTRNRKHYNFNSNLDLCLNLVVGTREGLRKRNTRGIFYSLPVFNRYRFSHKLQDLYSRSHEISRLAHSKNFNNVISVMQWRLRIKIYDDVIETRAINSHFVRHKILNLNFRESSTFVDYLTRRRCNASVSPESEINIDLRSPPWAVSHSCVYINPTTTNYAAAANCAIRTVPAISLYRLNAQLQRLPIILTCKINCDLRMALANVRVITG